MRPAVVTGLLRQRNPPGVGRVTGIFQGVLQRGIGVRLHHAVRQADVARINMDGFRPAHALAGDEFQDAIFRVARALEVSVTVEKPLRKFIVRVQVDEVTDVLIVQTNEVGGGGARIVGANQNLRRAQFVRHDLKMAEGVRARVEFLGAAGIFRDRHRIFVIVIARPDAEREAALLQIIDTADARGLLLGRRQRGQKHRGQNGEHGNDDQQCDQGETSFRGMTNGGVHAPTMMRLPLISSYSWDDAFDKHPASLPLKKNFSRTFNKLEIRQRGLPKSLVPFLIPRRAIIMNTGTIYLGKGYHSEAVRLNDTFLHQASLL